MEKLEFRGRKELRELLHEPPEGLLGIVKLLNCQFDEAAKIFSEKRFAFYL